MALKTPLLDQIKSPNDLKNFKPDQLQQIADELRAETIDSVSVTGGHLGAGLGVVELTVALHYLFDTPDDKIVWDVGHQVYPHKILTGRRDRIRTLRQGGRGCPVSPSAPKANTIRLARPTHRRRSRRRSASRSPAICRERTTRRSR